MTKKILNLKIERLPYDQLNLVSLNLPILKKPLVDLRQKMPPVYDQGELGSCTANALCALMEYIDHIKGSRLFLYYNERKIENDIPDDAGATLSDGIKCLVKYGICSETSWSYDQTKFTLKPPITCYNEALKYKALIVKNILQDMTHMKTLLVENNPFVVGIAVYESFMSDEVAKTGYVPMPSYDEICEGGHAVLCVGYDDKKRVWIMRNSWSDLWGDKGYFYLPYEYLLDSSLSSDLWTISKAT